MSADLTIEQARSEAQAWAEWHRPSARRSAANDYDAESVGDWDPHDDDRVAALESWVRGVMRESPATSKIGKCWAVIEVLRDGGPHFVESMAWALCKQAGWPTSKITSEQASKLAERWWAVRLYEAALQEWRDGDRVGRPSPPPFWALAADERDVLLAWVRGETIDLGEDDGARRIIGLLGWEYHAGYGKPSHDDALALLRAAWSRGEKP